MAITEFLHGHPLAAGEGHRRGLDDRSRDQHHPWPRDLDGGHGGTGVVVIVVGILTAYKLAGIGGVAVAVVAMLSMAGLIVALRCVRADHRQRRRHRRDGGSARGGAGITDPLDAVGNTTKAVTKGYAIGSAGLGGAGPVRRPTTTSCSRSSRRRQDGPGQPGLVLQPGSAWVMTGLLIGGLMPFLFSSMAMKAVGRAGGAVVEEVRRAVPRDPRGSWRARPARVRALRRPRDPRGPQGDADPLADPDRDPDRRRR